MKTQKPAACMRKPAMCVDLECSGTCVRLKAWSLAEAVNPEPNKALQALNIPENS